MAYDKSLFMATRAWNFCYLLLLPGRKNVIYLIDTYRFVFLAIYFKLFPKLIKYSTCYPVEKFLVN